MDKVISRMCRCFSIIEVRPNSINQLLLLEMAMESMYKSNIDYRGKDTSGIGRQTHKYVCYFRCPALNKWLLTQAACRRPLLIFDSKRIHFDEKMSCFPFVSSFNQCHQSTDLCLRHVYIYQYI